MSYAVDEALAVAVAGSLWAKAEGARPSVGPTAVSSATAITAARRKREPISEPPPVARAVAIGRPELVRGKPTFTPVPMRWQVAQAPCSLARLAPGRVARPRETGC